jgi:hypothetical protein
VFAINEDICLQNSQRETIRESSSTHSFDVAMNHP